MSVSCKLAYTWQAVSGGTPSSANMWCNIAPCHITCGICLMISSVEWQYMPENMNAVLFCFGWVILTLFGSVQIYDDDLIYLVIIGLDNGLVPIRHQAIIQTNADLSRKPNRITFNVFSFKWEVFVEENMLDVMIVWVSHHIGPVKEQLTVLNECSWFTWYIYPYSPAVCHALGYLEAHD